MIEKIVYTLITLKNKCNIPRYIPSKGIVLCQNTNDVIFRLPFIEIKKYYYFQLVFDHYQYDDFYYPHLKNYQKRISKRVYKMYLCINLPKVLNCKHQMIYSILSLHLCFANMNRLFHKRKYNCDLKNVCHFIGYRNQNYVSINPWYLVKINDCFYFDLKKKQFITNRSTNLLFKRKGGIIETNNITKTINEHFKHLSKSLIILPAQMNNLWDGYHQITYEQLNDLDLASIKKFDHQYDQIIIHECHAKYLPIIKYIIDSINCRTIWIINGLPLKYYFDINHSKLSINQIMQISNLWLNFNQKQKRKHKTSIYLALLHNFNQYYTIVNYANNIDAITVNEIQISAFEKHLYNIYNEHLEYWRSKLINDPKNKYSYGTKRINDILNARIYAAVLILMFSVVKYHEIPIFFKNKIQHEMQRLTLLKERKYDLISRYTNINKLRTSRITNIHVVNMEEMIHQLHHTYHKLSCKMNNLIGYSKNGVYTKYDDETCQICYSDEKLPSAKLICGHTICVECTLNSLGKSAKCPICQEIININSLAIIQDTIQNYHSALISFINHLPEKSILITDFDISSTKINVINLNHPKLLFQLIESNQFNQVHILSSTIESMILDQIIGYIMTIKKDINIQRIMVKIND